MSPKVILAFLCLTIVSSSVQADRKWTNLKVHFSANPLSKYYYQTQPRQLSDVKTNSWINISNGDCTNGGKYYGLRYVEKSETGMALLFDVHGTIAGIQQILYKDQIETNNQFRFEKVPSYNPDTLDGKEVYVLTAYFVDPSTICTTGRPASDLKETGTGNILLLQNGPTPSDLVLLPRQRSQAIAEGWTRNKCFVGMGYHNFYQVETMAETSCLEVRPLFGLYDHNDWLIGFGFVAVGTSQSNHFEHPPAAAVKAIVGADIVPKCLLDLADNPGLSTMHVFFNDFPNLYNCIL